MIVMRRPACCKLDHALHRLAAPRLIFRLDGQNTRFYPLGGIDAIEHGQQKFRPCAFSGFVRHLQDVQAICKRQRLLFKSAERRGHAQKLHSAASLPSMAAQPQRAASAIHMSVRSHSQPRHTAP